MVLGGKTPRKGNCYTHLRPKQVAGVGMADSEAGRVTHYFPKLQVAVILLSAPLKNGDMIRVVGRSAFSQQASSLQIDHAQVQQAAAGQSVALKVVQAVREGDRVYKLGMDLQKAAV